MSSRLSVQQNGAQKRRKMYPAKEKAEGNISSDAGFHKLDMKVRAFTKNMCLMFIFDAF